MTATVRGIPDVRNALRGLAPKLRSKILLPILRSAVRSTVLETARSAAPVLSPGNAIRSPNRTPGLLRKSIALRASKEARRLGNVGVYVSVRRARGAKYSVSRMRVAGIKITRRVLKRASQRGTASDPFYFRFVELGTSKMAARPFLRPAARRLGDTLRIITRELGAEFRPDGGGLKR